MNNNDGLISMSYDWISQNLYYVDNVRNSLEMVSTQETKHTRSLITGLFEPTSVVVHPLKGFVDFSPV